MFLVRVIPIARGIFLDHLTFFSKAFLEPGSVVPIRVRQRALFGIVTESIDARDQKLDIRTAEYALKKIDAAEPKRVLSQPFMEAVHDVAHFHVGSTGSVIAALTPKPILESLARVLSAPRLDTLAEVKPDVVVLQAEREERVRMYRNLARESFARGESVFLIAPSIIETEILAHEIQRGIEPHVVMFTGELSKKKMIESWNRIIEETVPLLVIGTPSVLSAPRRTLGAVVVERESARSYRSRERPHIDFRKVAEALSRATGARLILADFPIRVETRYRVDAGTAEELSRSQVRPSGNTVVTIIDSRKLEERRGEKRVFSTLSKESKQHIDETMQKGGRAVIFAARRGFAPLTVCNDCGTPVTDPSTGTPMVLHKTSAGNIFLSHRSGATLPSGTTCRICRGWNLVTLGIGVERVYEELEKSFPKANVMTLTSDSAKTHKAAKKIAGELYASEKSILVGTERMLPYITKPVELSVVTSFDSILSQSSWRAHEQALSILYFLRERSEYSCIVETRKPDHEVIKTFSSGNPLDFYRSDIAERERYGYPPFAIFIALSIRGTKNAVDEFNETVKKKFETFDLVGPLPASQIAKNVWTARAVIRLKAHEWPNEQLAQLLKELPVAIDIEIDPDDIV